MSDLNKPAERRNQLRQMDVKELLSRLLDTGPARGFHSRRIAFQTERCPVARIDLPFAGANERRQVSPKVGDEDAQAIQRAEHTTAEQCHHTVARLSHEPGNSPLTRMFIVQLIKDDFERLL